MTMAPSDKGYTAGKAPTTVPTGTIIRAIGRSRSRIDPRLGRDVVHHAGRLLLRLPPRDVNCLLRHARANLPLTNQCPVRRRKLIEGRAIRIDARTHRAAARKK